MLTPEQITKAAAHWDRWTDAGAQGLVAELERRAAASEAWAARSPYKGGKRKAAALAEAARLRAEAAQVRAAVSA